VRYNYKKALKSKGNIDRLEVSEKLIGLMYDQAERASVENIVRLGLSSVTLNYRMDLLVYRNKLHLTVSRYDDVLDINVSTVKKLFESKVDTDTLKTIWGILKGEPLFL